MLTNCDVTIYNKYTENRETKYKKSYIKNVHWEDRKGTNVIQSGLETADQSIVYIPFASGEAYQKPKDFKKNLKGFTLQAEDILVKGLIEDEFTTIKNLEKAYDDVRVITKVDTRDYGSFDLQHWEVGAN